MTTNDNSIDDSEEYVSKTQLKNEAKALLAFAKELLQLPVAKLETLPIGSNTMRALQDYEKQSGNIAKKRHLAYIGKCLRNDEVDEIKLALQEENFHQFRQQQDSSSGLADLVNSLIENGDSAIEDLLRQHQQLDRQNLRQLIRNCKNAKTPQKLTNSTNKLKTYLQSYQIN